MIKIIFFASYRERASCSSLVLETGGASIPIREVLSLLRTRLEARSDFLSDPKLLVAVNQQRADHDTPVKDGDEVAFFPPVTGG